MATDGTMLFFTPTGKMLAEAPEQRAPSLGDHGMLSDGAALYRDSVIPWEIEAEAREAVEESLE